MSRTAAAGVNPGALWGTAKSRTAYGSDAVGAQAASVISILKKQFRLDRQPPKPAPVGREGTNAAAANNFHGSGGDNQAPIMEIMFAPGLKDAGRSAAFVIVRAFTIRTGASVGASATGDGGIALEFSGGNGREIDVVVPEDGAPIFFVTRHGSERSSGVMDGPEGVPLLCEWLERGGDAPGKPLPRKA